jgi:uncharacterized protein YkwD
MLDDEQRASGTLDAMRLRSVVGVLCALGLRAGARPPVSSEDAKALVEAHNRVRARHCAPPLAWSSELATSAQKWARALGDRGCALQHSGGAHGENLAAGTSSIMDPASVVGLWYGEVKGYSFRRPGFSMKAGHFTQVVWRDTKRVGCGRASCDGIDLWVCQYDPPGNVEDQYRENVLPTSCQ